MKNNKGITIIALVVTIIVLLILSSISISYVVNKNGIIDNVNKNKENAEIRSIESKLQTESTSFNIQNNGKLNLDKYISKVKNIDEWNVEDNDDENEIAEDVKKNVKEILVNDKYVFEIKLDSEGIKIEYLGRKGELGPRIIWHTYSNTYDTLTLNVVTRRNKGGTLEYFIKEKGTEGEYKLENTTSSNTYTFTALNVNKKYTIKVIAKNRNKESIPYIIDANMVKLPELTKSNTTFTYSPTDWTNGTVKVTANTKLTGFTIQTSKDAVNWQTTATQTFDKNGTMYARLYDGKNAGRMMSAAVTNIDKTLPNVSNITIDYVQLANADDKTKEKYKYKGQFKENVDVNAGEIFMNSANGCYYLCIKSFQAGVNTSITSTEYFRELTRIYNASLKINVTASDAPATSQSGSSGIKDIFLSNDDGKTWRDANVEGTKGTTEQKHTYEFSDLTPGSKYTFKVKVVDNAGNERIVNGPTDGIDDKKTKTVQLKEIIENPKIYYGKTVTNYKPSNGWSGWKIFYYNPNNSYGKIFLIADDFVPNKLIPDGIGVTKTGTYKANWQEVNLTSSTYISSDRLQTFMGTGFAIAGKNNKGAIAASRLLDTSKWTNFVDSGKAQLAIGGPTIEMWMASWNTLYPNDKLYCNNTNNYGYYVGDTTSGTSTDANDPSKGYAIVNGSAVKHYIARETMIKKEGYNNTLFYSHKEAGSDGVRTYWCASPSSWDSGDVPVGRRLINIDCIGFLGSDPCNFEPAGMRPVVCLRDDFLIEIIN